MTAATIKGASAIRVTRSISKDIASTVPRGRAVGNYPGSSAPRPGALRQSAVQLYGDWL
jgi:hypothetical protein